jgi:hypothetical protein
MNPFEWMDHWLRYLGYHLRYNKIARRIKIECEFWNIDRRLKRKGFSMDKILDVMQRYVTMRSFKDEKETKESIISLGRAMAELSEKTGIPQWQLRAKVKKDFNIDL